MEVLWLPFFVDFFLLFVELLIFLFFFFWFSFVFLYFSRFSTVVAPVFSDFGVFEDENSVVNSQNPIVARAQAKAAKNPKEFDLESVVTEAPRQAFFHPRKEVRRP